MRYILQAGGRAELSVALSYKILPNRAARLLYKAAMEQSPHILFVEDDVDIRTLVADFLVQNGYRMSVAGEGRELDRALEVGRIDLLILDIMLPKEDGALAVPPNSGGERCSHHHADGARAARSIEWWASRWAPTII